MTERVRISGEFCEINFQTKTKKERIDHTAVLTFRLPLSDNALEDATRLVAWQRQTVAIDVSKLQPSLLGEDRKPQVDLPLAAFPGPGASPAEASAEDLMAIWKERTVDGPDDISRGIFVRGDGRAFTCWDCAVVFELEEGEDLGVEVSRHVCVEDPGEIDSNRIGVEDLEMRVKIVCNDGINRKFNYSIETWREKGAGFTCDECNEEEDIRMDAPILPFALLAAHVCPPVCHKCHASKKHGEAFADQLLFHHLACPLAQLHNPEVGVATSLEVLGVDPYTGLVEASPSTEAAKFILEDATETFARIVEACGLPRSVGRENHNQYTGLETVSKKARSALLKEIKKAGGKDLWNRANVLLQDFDAAKSALKDREKKEMEEERRK